MRQKPVDRWLSLFGYALSVVLFLLPKIPWVILLCLFMVFGLLIHPLWNFWLLEERLWRKIIACSFLILVLGLLGYISWPNSIEQPQKLGQSSMSAENNNTLNAPNALIATQDQTGDNFVSNFIGKQGRHLTPELKLMLDHYAETYRGQSVEVRSDSSDEASDYAKEIRDYLILNGVKAYIDPTSTYSGSFGYGLIINPNSPIIKVGKNPN